MCPPPPQYKPILPTMCAAAYLRLRCWFRKALASIETGDSKRKLGHSEGVSAVSEQKKVLSAVDNSVLVLASFFICCYWLQNIWELNMAEQRLVVPFVPLTL